MREAGANLANKAVALLVLVIALWILLKFVVGIVAGLATFIVVVVAIGAVVWAVNRL